MTPTTIARRLTSLEARLAPLRPRGPAEPFAWLSWLSIEELIEVQHLAETERYGRDLTEPEQLRAVELEVQALRRQMDGEQGQGRVLLSGRPD